MQIESVGLLVILIHIHFIYLAYVYGIIHELLPVAMSLFFGEHEQHLQHIVA